MEKENKNDKEITMDDLARIVQNGLLKIDERFDGVEERLDKIETDVKEIKLDTGEIKAELNKKVDKIDHNTLTYRVEKLEKKFA